jgi:outer membrane protein assembly factor BamB
MKKIFTMLGLLFSVLSFGQAPTTLWSYNLPDRMGRTATPAVGADGTIYIGCDLSTRPSVTPPAFPASNFFAINPNGTVKWSTSIAEAPTAVAPATTKPDNILSSASVHPDGSIYTGGQFSQHVFKLNPADGSRTALRKIDTRQRYTAPVFSCDGSTVYVCGYSVGDRGVRSLSADLTTQNWIFKPDAVSANVATNGASPNDFNCTPALATDGTIYAASGNSGGNNKLFAINPNGTQKWASASLVNFVSSAIAIGPDGTIYVSAKLNTVVAPALPDGCLKAFNPIDGSEKWSVTFPSSNAEQGGPAIAADGTIYLGSIGGRMRAFNPANGAELWQYPLAENPAIGQIEVVPAIDNNGKIYFGTTGATGGGMFYVLNSDGTEAYTPMSLGTSITSAATIGSDGTIYVASTDTTLPLGAGRGRLFALQTTATGLASGNWPMYAINASHAGHISTTPTTNTTVVSNFASYTWANNGQTYTTSGIYTGYSSGCVTEILDLTISQIPPTFPAFCKGATVATATGTTSLKFYNALTGGLPLAGTTALATGKTLFVTEVVNSVESSPRVSRLITVNVIPATPASITTTDAVLCKYVGTTNTVTYTVATVENATSYLWSVPAGANVIADASATDNVITVNFLNSPLNNISVGGLGTISARAVNSFDCPSAPRSLVLTAKLPTAPTALTMTSADSTPSFKGIITPADPLAVPPTAAVYGLVGLNTLTTGIKKVGPYIGTETVFTMTAPAAVTAASYLWTLPTGVNAIASSTVAISLLGVVTSTTPIITANFADVDPGTTALPIVVQSVGGCGNSTNRTLSLARALPTAPTALVLTNTSQANLSSLLKITKVGPYTDTDIPFTLTATPFTTQGAEATSYAWVLPAGVVCTSSYNTGVTPLTGSTVIATVPTPWTITDYITTTTSTITVKFSGVTGTGNLALSVYAVNGAGNSIARTLTLARALPTAPTKLELKDGATVLTNVGAYTAKTTSLTLTATPFTTQGAEATSFNWVLPAGVNVTAGASLSTDNGTTKTWTGTASVLTINLAGISGPSMTSIPLNVYAVNGAGTSATARTLTVTSAVPATPAIVGSTGTTFSRCVTTTYTATSIPGATYTWVVPTDAVIEGPTTGNVIVVNYAAVTMAVSAPVAVTCYATNGTGNSITKSLTVKRVAGCREASAAIADDFNVIAYPNPSSDVFTLDVQSSDKGATGIQVYDMAGRLIESRQAKSNSVEVGKNYASGIYNVKVNKGAQVKTLRVIKK